MPLGVDPNWSNGIHKGAANEQRDIAIWFYPGTTRLHVRSGTRRGWNDGGDPEPQLIPYQWTHVAVTHKEQAFTVYYNGEQVLTQDIPAPTHNDGPLYSGDPWHAAAPCILSDIRYVDSDLDGTAIKAVFHQKRYQPYKPKEVTIMKEGFKPTQNRQLVSAEQIGTNLVAYTYVFWIKPEGINPGWSNVIHKGSADGTRNPAIFFYPGQTRLHIRSGTKDSWNDGGDPDVQLPMNQWTHVTVIHMHSRMEVFYNGKSVLKEWKWQPISNDGPFYASNPWYPSANCVLSDIRLFRGSIDQSKIDEIISNNKHPA